MASELTTKAEAMAEHGVTGVEHVDSKTENVGIERQAEHDLTLKQVFRNHKALVWWSFFWAMAAVGWYALSFSSQNILELTFGVI